MGSPEQHISPQEERKEDRKRKRGYGTFEFGVIALKKSSTVFGWLQSTIIHQEGKKALKSRNSEW